MSAVGTIWRVFQVRGVRRAALGPRDSKRADSLSHAFRASCEEYAAWGRGPTRFKQNLASFFSHASRKARSVQEKGSPEELPSSRQRTLNSRRRGPARCALDLARVQATRTHLHLDDLLA